MELEESVQMCEGVNVFNWLRIMSNGGL